MSRFNDGNVYTNDKCIGCGKCVSKCFSLGANVSRYKDGKNRYEIGKRCIECGACVAACPHGARSYRDDAEQFFDDLKTGKKISVIIDPAFFIDYSDKISKVVSYLKSIGVQKVYDGSYGAEISMWMHARYMRSEPKEGEEKAIIANICSAVTRYIQSCRPELLPLVIPVRPAFSAMRVYVRKYLHDTNRIAYITPCIAKDAISEADLPDDKFDYRITFRNFWDACRDVDLDEYADDEAESAGFGMGYLSVALDGFEAGIRNVTSRDLVVLRYHNNCESLDRLMNDMKTADSKQKPDLLLLDICEGSCLLGSGMERSSVSRRQVYEAYKDVYKKVYKNFSPDMTEDERYEVANVMLAELDPSDFEYSYKDMYQQRFFVPDHIIDEIFNVMLKTTPEKRAINCGSCGYHTCKQLAIAVANGYANKQDCIHYLNDNLFESNFRDNKLGCLNGTGFYRELNRLLDSYPERKYVVVAGNINRLRDVNSLYGRESGDRVLAHAKDFFNEYVSEHGAVARMQGSQFAFAFEYSQEKLDKLQEYKEFSVQHKGVLHTYSVRFGIVITGDDIPKESAEQLVAYASYACDLSRNRSGNAYTFFEADMIKRMNLEMRITSEMKTAMKNGEYVLYAQPQYSHSDGSMVGAEILSRWIRRDGTFVMPGDFISVFEKNGFIKDFDRYIWESSFALVKKWEDEGAPIVPMSVNISRFSMADDDVVDVIADLYDKYRIDKKHLHLEITESAYIENQKAVTDRITKLRELGFVIAMDDFGSGYSSLNSLKDIPIDILKLDMGFVRGNRYSEKGMCIIEYMIGMANALGLETVAEGVEAKEMADAILSAGCDTIQGYLYAKPMPIAEFEKLLTNQ